MTLKYPPSGMAQKELDAITTALVDLMEMWVGAGLIVTPGVDHNLLITMTHAVETALINSCREDQGGGPLKKFNPPESRWSLTSRK